MDNSSGQYPPLGEWIAKFRTGAMSRREFIGTLALAGFSMSAIGAIVAACSGAASPKAVASAVAAVTSAAPASAAPVASAATGAPVTINMAHWDPGQVEDFKLVAAAFEKVNPNITVVVNLVPYSEFWSKLTTGMAAGTAPDIFVDISNFIKQYEANNTLLDLAPYIKRDGIDLTAYAPVSLTSFAVGASQYALPFAVNTIGVFSNTALLAKAGFSAYPDHLTWAPDGSGTYLPFLQKLTIDNKGVSADQPGFDASHIVQYGCGLSPDNTQEFADIFMLENGGGYQMTPGGPPTINSPANVATYQFISDLMYKYHVAPPGATVAPPNGGAEENQFLSGLVATLMGGDWYIQPVYAGAKFKFGVNPLPYGPKGQISTINAGGLSIPAVCKHVEAAWSFVKYSCTAPGQAVTAGTGGMQSSILSMDHVFLDAWKAKGIDATPVFNAWNAGNEVFVPTGPQINPVQTATDADVVAIYLNSSSVQAALDKAQADAMAAYQGKT